MTSEYLAQNSEDKIIFDILKIIHQGEHSNEEKWCVEFGAWDGIHLSNTNLFIKNENYHAILIEGDKDKFSSLVKNMAIYPNVKCFEKYVGFEGGDKLDNILAQTNIPYEFEFVSIDIDGNDYHVWDAFQNYRPKLVIIEFNPSISNEIEFVQEKNVSLNHGSSPKSLVTLAKSKGYELVTTNLNNCFFVEKKYFHLFDISDNSLAKLRTDLSRVTYLFNGYDGHVFIRGYGQMDLYSMPYNEARMQLFPTFLQEWSPKNKFKRRLHRIYKSLRKRNII